MNKPIAILGAISEEISGIKQAMNIADRVRLGKSEAWLGKWQGKDIVLVRTGVGKERAEDATRQVIERFQPGAIISMGYAGALVADLNVGDLFIADSIKDAGCNSANSEFELQLNSKWLDLAKNIPTSEGAQVRVGKLITVDSVIHTPKAKQDLGNQFAAEAVEMETIVIARLAQERQVPFISVRGISDAVDHELIDSSSFLGSDGEISKLKAGWYVLTHPKSFKDAVSLRSQTQIATRNLTLYISNLISK